MVVTIHAAVEQPGLGIDWAPAMDNRGLIVRSAAETTALPPAGTRIKSIQSPAGLFVPLGKDLLLEDPDQYATYSEYNRFFERQKLLKSVYDSGTVILSAGNGRQWPIAVQSGRALNQLPFSFWVLNLSAAVCALIGSGVWWYRPGEISAKLLATTAVCYYLSILCLSIYGSRELFLEPALFLFLSAANHLFTLTWCYSLLLLVVFYPIRMGGMRSIAAVYFIALSVWANQTLQVIEVPVHAYYGLNHIVPYGIGIFVGYRQWRRTARRPVERAAFRWFILSIWISIGISGSSFIVPSLTDNSGKIPLYVPALSIMFMFICFALGIFRYGLFNLEHWWLTGWTWLAAGLFISAIDILIVFILDIRIEFVLPYSILLLGWIYFPLRQWLWQRLAKPEIYQLEHHMPVLIQSLFNSRSMQSFIDRWTELLKEIFQPLDIIVEQGMNRDVVTRQHGFELKVPNLDGKNVCRLIGNRQGSRLFGSKDINLAKSLFSLSQAIFTITNHTRQVQHEGAKRERERIMRDLHDDVLPKLISIKQLSESSAIEKMAGAAFQSIRDTIYLLRYSSNKPLEEVLADWRAEVAERLAAARLDLDWRCPDQRNRCHLSPRQFINCGRILREAVSNIIKHARAGSVHISFDIVDHKFHMSVSDNGAGAGEPFLNGMGTSNMRLRARALGGTITWEPNSSSSAGIQKGMTVSITFPLDDP